MLKNKTAKKNVTVKNAKKEKSEKKQRNFSFSKKLLVLFCVPFLMAGIIISVMCTILLENNIEREIRESLRTVACSLDSTYNNLYEGEYHRDNAYRLFKGTTQISGKTELLDDIKKSASVETSMYFENKIEVTTLMQDTGGRAMGIEIEDDIYEKLKAGKEVFISDYELQGSTYFGYFIPLKNNDTVVGSIFAGRKSAEVSQRIAGQISLLVSILIGIMLIFLAFLLIFSSYLSKSMKRTTKFLKKVAGGELASSTEGRVVRNRDEIGDIYRIAVHLQSELRDIVGNMKSSADTLLDSSYELTVVSEEIHKNVGKTYEAAEDTVSHAEEQAATTELAVTTISEIGEKIEFITHEMESMHNSIIAMSLAEETSHDVIDAFSDSNHEVMKTIDEFATQINITNEFVKRIQSTISMIQSIADETNLLSVNASIEAAHAGAAGSGFAVIAEQISRLAIQSANNAVDVEKVIISLQEESAKMVVLMDKVRIMMNDQRGKLKETIANFEIVEDGVTSSKKSVEIVKKHMDELAKSKDTVLDNVHRQAEIAERFVENTESVTDMVRIVDERMEKLDGTALQLKEISDKMCCELSVFNCK